jgi:type IV pilus assembly protein PilQ
MRHLARLVAAGAVVAAASAWGAELNALSELNIVSTTKGAQVVVHGSRSPTFTVFRLNDPDRLVVDLSSADASAIKGHHDGVGPIAGIVASQFSDQHASVGRVLVSLDGASQYDVRADGNRVVITVDGNAPGSGMTPLARPPTAPPVSSASPPPELGNPHAQPIAAESVGAAEQDGTHAESIPKPGPEAKTADGEVVASQVDEQPVKNPAKRLVALSFRHETLEVTADGELPKYELLQLKDPPRLALDIYGVSSSVRPPRVHSASLKEIRVGVHLDKVRVVMDVKGQMPVYRASRRPHGMKVDFGPLAPAQVAESKPSSATAAATSGLSDGEIEIDGKKVEREEAPHAEVAPAEHARLIEVRDIGFDDDSTGGRVSIKFAGKAAWSVDHPDAKSAVLALKGAHLPKTLERSFDTSALDTPVKMVSAFGVPGAAGEVRVVVSAGGALEDSVLVTPSGLSWRLSAKGVKTQEVAVTQRTAGFASEAPAYASESAPRQRRHYVGKRVSFEFKDIDIHNLLRVIAEVSKKNIVVADDVKGTVTIRLRNVPWDEALDLILRSKGLGKEDLGNVMRVAPLKTLEDEAKLQAERQKSLKISEPLVVQLVPVNYANAEEMASRVKEVLSDRGNVTVDARTNVLIIRDAVSNIGRARSLVQTLDLQTPQVLIESRIVEANVTYSKQIGVQWGGQAQAAPGSGNPTGLAFPNTIIGAGGAGTGPTSGTALNPNYAVNLPAAVGQGSGGALGFIFGSAGGALNLNLRLSALETEGVVKTISAPKVATLDNIAAKISQGVSIPFSQTSAAGVNTTFVEARLSLEVTPHITQDGSVVMKINAQNDQPDPSNTGANGQPAIQRKQATTQVMVKDGDTTVIGGIYVRRASTTLSDVPLLGRIPLLGFFFRNTNDTDTRQELLIFITPRILNRQTIATNIEGH